MFISLSDCKGSHFSTAIQIIFMLLSCGGKQPIDNGSL